MQLCLSSKLVLVASLAAVLSACGGSGKQVLLTPEQNPVQVSSISSAIANSSVEPVTRASSSVGNSSLFTSSALAASSWVNSSSIVTVVNSSAAASLAAADGPAGSSTGSSQVSISTSLAASSAALDRVAPSAQVIFPTPFSTTEGDSVLVRGTAADSMGRVTRVQVNGLDATSDDNFANWQVSVALAVGENKLKIVAQDNAGNIAQDAAEITVLRPLLLPSPTAFTLDKTRHRALVADSQLRAVVAIDLLSGARKLLSDVSTLDDTNNLQDITGIAIDEDRGRALLVDRVLDRIVALDLATGAHKPLPGDSTIRFSDAQAIAVDALHKRALVVDAGNDAVIAVDLETGKRKLLASLEGFPLGITLDPANNRALVIDSVLKAVIAINLENGSSEIVSQNATSNSGIYFQRPVEIALDADGNRALVADTNTASIVAVNLKTGKRDFLLSKMVAGAPDFKWVADIAIDRDNNRAIVLDTGHKELIAVDLASGMRSFLTSTGMPDLTQSLLKSPEAIAFDTERNRALIVDKVLKGVVAVDLTSGVRSLFAVNSALETASDFSSPVGIAVDGERKRALVVDDDRDAVVAVNLVTGARSLLTEGQTDAEGKTNFKPYAITLDLARKRALVLDYAVNGVVAVSLLDGSRTVLSANDPLKRTEASDFSWPHDLVLDSGRGRVLVADNGSQAVIAVNLETGARSLVSSRDLPAPTTPKPLLLDRPYGIALDAASKCALVADKAIGQLIAVDLISGARSLISGRDVADSNILMRDVPNAINRFAYPVFTAVDPQGGRALVVDGILRAIFAVDLVTGERVFFAK